MYRTYTNTSSHTNLHIKPRIAMLIYIKPRIGMLFQPPGAAAAPLGITLKEGSA